MEEEINKLKQLIDKLQIVQSCLQVCASNIESIKKLNEIGLNINGELYKNKELTNIKQHIEADINAISNAMPQIEQEIARLTELSELEKSNNSISTGGIL